ncbi:hypothetical protein D9M71_502060 [compost metagenome]
MGVCQLCEEEKKLRKSHLMPKAAYKYLRDKKESGGGSPMRIHLDSKEAFFTDIQVTKYLLCDDCEQRFSSGGEAAVSRMWATHKVFPLLERLLSAATPLEGPRFALFPPDRVGKKELEELFYFGASVIWRSNHWDWGRHTSSHKDTLGKIYERKFRDYLMGRTSGIEGVRLLVTLNSNYQTHSLMRFPLYSRGSGCSFHSFDLLGMFFHFIVGGSPNRDLIAPFDKTGSDTLVLVADMAVTGDLIRMAEEVNKAFPNGI